MHISSLMVIMLGRQSVCLVHAHLKDVLGHLQTEWHVQEAVPACKYLVGIEQGLVGKTSHQDIWSRSHPLHPAY